MKSLQTRDREAPDCGPPKGCSVAKMNVNTVKKVKGGRGTKYSSLVYASLVVMVLVLVYVWCHVQITEVNYEMARAIKVREKLLEENGKLKVEIERLTSPSRVEEYAREKLNMDYPERDQVVVLR